MNGEGSMAGRIVTLWLLWLTGWGGVLGSVTDSRADPVADPARLPAAVMGSECLPPVLTPLATASALGAREGVAALLARGADPNGHRGVGCAVPALTLAVEGRHLAIARLLLEEGADPGARLTGADPPLHRAVKNDDLPMVKLLLGHGADPEARDDEGFTAIHWARRGNVEWQRARVTEALLGAGAAHFVDGRCEVLMLEGLAPGLEAGGEGELRAALAAGADPNDHRQGPCRIPALVWAAQQGYREMVEILLAAGADPDARAPGSDAALHQAARRGDLAMVELLLRRGADPRARGEEESTALHWAVERGHLAVVEALLAAGADPSAVDDLGFPPWYYMLETGNLDLLIPFVRRGVVVIDGRHGEQGLTLLHVGAAAPRMAPSTITGIVALGADVNAVSLEGGVTPLHLAVLSGTAETARTLLEQGAAIDRQDVAGGTPLHWAVREGREEMARLLLERGADPTVRDEAGQSPRDLAAPELKALLWPPGGSSSGSVR